MSFIFIKLLFSLSLIKSDLCNEFVNIQKEMFKFESIWNPFAIQTSAAKLAKIHIISI